MVFEIVWAPTLVAFAANFVVGAVWYGAFGKPWMREVGITPEDMKAGKWPMPSYVIAAVGAAVQALVMSLVVLWARPTGLGQALLIGALLGLAAAFATGKHHAFGRRTWTLFAIDGGNDFCGFVGMGLVFGLWL